MKGKKYAEAMGQSHQPPDNDEDDPPTSPIRYEMQAMRPCCAANSGAFTLTAPTISSPPYDAAANRLKYCLSLHRGQLIVESLPPENASPLSAEPYPTQQARAYQSDFEIPLFSPARVQIRHYHRHTVIRYQYFRSAPRSPSNGLDRMTALRPSRPKPARSRKMGASFARAVDAD